MSSHSYVFFNSTCLFSCASLWLQELNLEMSLEVCCTLKNSSGLKENYVGHFDNMIGEVYRGIQSGAVESLNVYSDFDRNCCK